MSDNQCGQATKSSTFSRRKFLVAAGACFTSACTSKLGMGRVFGLSEKDAQAAYAKAMSAHQSLTGYWRFDDNVIDAISGEAAKVTGAASFESGANFGQAVSLTPTSTVSVPDAEHLRGRSATIEFFFKVDAKPNDDKNPVLISQTDGEKVRYIIGVKNDLSALLYRNSKDKVVTEINLPTNQPIEVGRWYHFAITSYDLDVRVYIDGFESSLVGGAYEFSRRGPKKSAMILGKSTVDDWGSTDICIDELACFSEGLTQDQIQTHLIAGGFSAQLAATRALVNQVAAKRNAVRAAKTHHRLNDASLTAKGKTHVYAAEYLAAIKFTVGGIGAGAIQFDGDAVPAIWQIATNYQEHNIDDSFLAIRAQAEGNSPVVRALRTKAAGEFSAMKSLSFEGEYPLGKYKFVEPALPVDVELEVFNPFIPMDLKNSSIPCVIYTVKVKNPSSSKVVVDILGAQKNALGYAEGKKGNFGNNQNHIVTQDDATLLHMTRSGNNNSDMVLMTQAEGAKGTAAWQSSAQLLKDFQQQGSFEGAKHSAISAAGETVQGALSAQLTLAPGESKSVTFVLTWYFKEATHGDKKSWTGSGHMYTNWWPSAVGVANYLQDNLADLTRRTRLFHQTMYESNLPVWLLDRMTSQLAVLRSQTCWWSEDGYFGAWEGVNPEDGCCAGNCTHVWHYAQAHARLLPELGRKMREQDYNRQADNGMVPYRHSNKKPAADGFFGTILNTYREHQCSSDQQWLRSQWPSIKKAMDWGIDHWDPKRDGFMQTQQHNTLDGNFEGCSSWIGSLYLSALSAAANMAELMGDMSSAKTYRAIRLSGMNLQNQRLWNGEYYIQEPGKKRNQDYLDGCHIDQILGEWWADQISIERNYPAERSRKSMQSLLKYNFRADFYGQSLKPRQYCEVSDGGMKMITWPNNPQPIPGMKYGDEVMTGFEYGAAVSMMQNDMVHEGLMVIRTIADRYDGRLHTEGVTDAINGPWGYSGNPFGDDECGKYYGRSLSVWSALTALQGFVYDGPAGLIGFRPVLHAESHASFFTVAQGYGLFKQDLNANKLNASIALREGQVQLSEIILAVKASPKSVDVKLVIAGQSKVIKSQVSYQNGDLKLILSKELHLKADQEIEISVLV